MNPRNFIRNHVTLFSILLFFLLYGMTLFSRSSLIYNKDGSLRNFGIGYSTKSVLPLWLLSIVLAIMSYFIVLRAAFFTNVQF